MAFIVEDGSIVPNANAYITVDKLKSYWLDRGVTLSQSPSVLQPAIIIATQYVDLNFQWKGSIVSDSQSLDWPRSDVYDNEGRPIASDIIPNQLEYAICEYAQRQLTSPIQPDVSPDGRGNVTKIMEKVDVIEREIEYEEGTGGYYGLKRYPLADNYLNGLTVSTVGSIGQLRRT